MSPTIITRHATREDAEIIAKAVAMAIGEEFALHDYCGEDYMSVLEEMLRSIAGAMPSLLRLRAMWRVQWLDTTGRNYMRLERVRSPFFALAWGVCLISWTRPSLVSATSTLLVCFLSIEAWVLEEPWLRHSACALLMMATTA